MNTVRRHQNRRKAVGLAAAGLAAALLILSAYLESVRRSAGREVSRLEKARDTLQATADRLEAERRKAETDKGIVLNVLGQCRSAEDIPDLPGDRVVARRQGMEKLCIYVPAGSHTLVISSKWKRTETPNQSADANEAVTAPDGEKIWRVPLQGNCGYFLQLVSDRRGGPMQWELTSNHPDFQTHAETVPVDGFSHQGSSWSGADIVQFPNQIQGFSIPELEAATTAPAGVNLMSTKLNGVCHDQPCEISFDVQVLSDAPACVSATDAQRIIIMGRADLLDPYEGSGKYTLRAANSAQSAP
jgi:hypothetical protein